MRNERRRQSRRVLQAGGRLQTGDGSIVAACEVQDISEVGARLRVKSDRLVPDEFTLLLSMDGAAHRQCRVVWRSGSDIGVKFSPTDLPAGVD